MEVEKENENMCCVVLSVSVHMMWEYLAELRPVASSFKFVWKVGVV